MKISQLLWTVVRCRLTLNWWVKFYQELSLMFRENYLVEDIAIRNWNCDPLRYFHHHDNNKSPAYLSAAQKYMPQIEIPLTKWCHMWAKRETKWQWLSVQLFIFSLNDHFFGLFPLASIENCKILSMNEQLDCFWHLQFWEEKKTRESRNVRKVHHKQMGGGNVNQKMCCRRQSKLFQFNSWF